MATDVAHLLSIVDILENERVLEWIRSPEDLEAAFRFLLQKYRCSVRPKNQIACQNTEDVSYCARCGRQFCPEHWDLYHGDEFQPQIAHEKTMPELAEMLREIFPADDRPKASLRRSIKKDAGSLWFGAIKSDDKWAFEERTAYEELVLNTPKTPSRVFPCLVSFVGQTGDGKSALINLLIKVACVSSLISESRETRFIRRHQPAPIIGTPGDSFPTSTHVHLYLDPQTSEETNPLLFADCEGFDGGEKDPRTLTPGADKPDTDFRRCSLKDIPWTKPPSEYNTRRFMVKEFYPRILYTFSDVVVFVLRNQRRHEDAVQQLADWAFDVIQSSTNQSVLPHAILVLNGSEIPVSSDCWEIDTATEQLLQEVKKSFFEQADLKKHVSLWRERYQKTPDEYPSAKELLESYYASVRVIHIPDGQIRMNLLERQVTKLYGELSQARDKSHERRKDLHMKLNAENFILFMNKAFDHFTTDFKTPFNFVRAWFEINQEYTVSDFRKGILDLALAAQKVSSREGLDLWQHISAMVASCILLNATRHELPLANTPAVFDEYWPRCDEALTIFYDRYWPCEFRDETDSRGNPYGRCVNVRGTHDAKGHQNEAGKPRAGEHIPSHTLYQVQERFKAITLAKFLELFEDPEASKDAWKVHQKTMSTFYKGAEEESAYSSSSTCFSCLCDIPQHSLPCRHIICVQCIGAAGIALGNGFIKLTQCPLMECKGNAWDGKTSWLISTKPPQAGVRIMTLDGGGVRGLIELEILHHLENVLGCGIPIRAFFDLIVGTSTGGLIALGLAHNWTIEKCRNTFDQFSKQAFSIRSPEWLGIFRHIISYKNRGRYDVRPLENALAAAFSAEPLFGGRLNVGSEPIKVAVTSTTANSQGTQVAVLSNYNRKSYAEGSYKFVRPENPRDDLTVAEMARATSAAPTYFKEFKHDSSQQTYLDGGIYHNNPIKIANAERKVIWPQSMNKHPDVVVSIGTGYVREDVKSTLDATTTLERGVQSYFHTLVNIGNDYIKNGLACERAWMDWIETLEPEPCHLNRYRRLNIPFDFEPEMDATDDKILETYRNRTRDEMRKNENLLQEIAAQLIASCFFFHFKSEDWNRDEMGCTGTIECRFAPGEDYFKQLGKYFQKLRKSPSTKQLPYLIVRETHRSSESNICYYVGEKDINRMADDGEFKMPIPVKVSNELAETEISLSLFEDQKLATPISGFPRKIQKDYPDLVRGPAPKSATSLRRRISDIAISRSIAISG